MTSSDVVMVGGYRFGFIAVWNYQEAKWLSHWNKLYEIETLVKYSGFHMADLTAYCLPVLNQWMCNGYECGMIGQPAMPIYKLCFY